MPLPHAAPLPPRRTIRSLYVHVPFCQTICGYCDFYSQVLDRGSVTPLVDSLLRELDLHAEQYDLQLDTIFVGGGTPTVLPPADLLRLLSRIRELAAPGCEFTVEANPATVTPQIADALAAGGVNRVSIGAQSFDRNELRVLERIHQPAQVGETVARVRSVGIQQVNLDLIFAIPGQNPARWQSNLAAALELQPTHLSCYGLTYEKGTPLFDQWQSGVVKRVDEDAEAAMFESTIDTLAAAGLAQYEISNFARSGAQCRHNLVYWRNEPALGVGPSAAGFDGEVRYKNIPDTAAYVRALNANTPPRLEAERLSFDRRMRETAMLGLRLIDGVGRESFAGRFGHDPLTLFDDGGKRFIEAGLLEMDNSRIRLTRRGLLLSDTVMAALL